MLVSVSAVNGLQTHAPQISGKDVPIPKHLAENNLKTDPFKYFLLLNPFKLYQIRDPFAA